MTTTTVKYDLKDLSSNSGKTVACTVNFSEGQICVQVAGHGDYSSADGSGVPVMIEYYEDSVWVTAWGDINQENPTLNLRLDGARESKRSPE